MTASFASRLSGVETSVAIKAPVRAATITDIELSGLQTVDGVALSTGDRVLVAGQSNAVENGVYVAASGAWARAIDFNGARDAVQGTRIYVNAGTQNGSRRLVLDTANPEIGAIALSFSFDSSGGGDGQNVYASRALAEADMPSADVEAIYVLTPSGSVLEYVKAGLSEANVALTTADGTDWVPPANYATPQHWKENTDPGVTDMTTALNAAGAFLSYGPINGLYDMIGAIKNSGEKTLDFMGEVIGVSAPVVVGDLDADLSGTAGDENSLPVVDFDGRGWGLATNIRITGGVLRALPGFDTTPLATFTITDDTYPDDDSPTGMFVTVPAYVMMVGTYSNIDRADFLRTRPFVSGISVEIDIDCNFRTGGIYIENAGVKIVRNNILNLAPSASPKPVSGPNTSPRTAGILTCVSDDELTAPNLHGLWNPRRHKSKATEMVLDNVTVYGYDRRTANQPDGWDEDTYNCIGFSIHTADFFMNECVATAVTTSAYLDGLRNAQLHNSHFWANEVIVGKDCSGLTISNTYADFTDWTFYSFEHNITGMHLRAGDCNLVLVATQASEDAAGLTIAGLTGNKNSTIVYEVDTTLDANASWAAQPALGHTLTGIDVERDDAFKEYYPGSRYIKADGTTVFIGAVEVGGISAGNPGQLSALGNVWLDDFGAKADGTDDATAWTAAHDFLDARGGGVLNLSGGKTYHVTPVTHASNVTVQMNGATLAVHSSTAKTGNWYTNRDAGTAKRVQIIGPGTFDGSDREFDRWLSQTDGTPITDPAADYVMGSGALASGISGVVLTAVLTGDAVTSVTVNNGGSGWNGHPTHPYLDTAVDIRFDGGGGFGAKAYGTISGGTLVSVTVENGGTGYTSVPMATTRGGYADIELLTTAGVDRRNPNYGASGSGVVLTDIDQPKVEGVDFTGFRCRTLLDAGCRGGVMRRLSFTDCGKDDGPFHAIWVQSRGAPGGSDPDYSPTEGILIEDIRAVSGIERSFVMFNPTGGGILRRAVARGPGESSVFMADTLCLDGGTALIEDCEFADNVLTDIAAAHIEGAGVRNLTVRKNLFKGSSAEAIAILGGQNVLVEGNIFEDNVTALTNTGDMRVPYGPFSERFGFNSGQRPTCGRPILIADGHVITIGAKTDFPGGGVKFRDNTVIETRAVHPKAVFRQEKLGTSLIGKDMTIEHNDVRDIPAAMEFLNTEFGTVWLATMPLHIRHNLGHASEAPVIVSHSLAATGTIAVDCGFRPSKVEVYAEVDNGARLRSSDGIFSWTRDGVRNDFVMAASSDGTDVRGSIVNNEVMRTVDPADGSTVNSVEFVRWTETGFELNCVTYGEAATLRLVCAP